MVNTAKSNNRNMGIFEEEENVKSVIRHSVKYGLDPAFVMAVFLMETGGDLSSSYGLRINNPGSIMTGSDYSVIKEFNLSLKTSMEGEIVYRGKLHVAIYIKVILHKDLQI